MDLKKLNAIRQLLKENSWDGWLLYDRQKSNPWPYQVLSLTERDFITRKWCVWIPCEGPIVVLKHKIEAQQLSYMEAEHILYLSWEDFESHLKIILSSSKKIAMEYFPFGRLPTVSRVEAGMIDLIRSWNIEVVSSLKLLPLCIEGWSQEQWNLHQQAASLLNSIADATWSWLSDILHRKVCVTEWDVQQFMIEKMRQANLVFEGDPICACGPNSADPHYQPRSTDSRMINSQDVVLIDLWGKIDEKMSVYADITRMAVVSDLPNQRQKKIFDCVRQAQKKATEFVKENIRLGNVISGADVDRVCRGVIEEAGYGKYFIHRTGHDIGVKDHGDGTHLDSFETLDDRPLLPRTCFSIEPGIYLPGEFGVRLEYDVFLDEEKNCIVTGGIQDAFVCLLEGKKSYV